MKKLTALFSALFIVVGLLPIPAGAIHGGEWLSEEMIQDPHMDAPQLPPWKPWGTTGLFFTAEKFDLPGGPGGIGIERVLHLFTNNTTGGVQQMGLPVEGGRTYLFSMSYQLRSGRLTPRFGIRTSNSDFENKADVLAQPTPAAFGAPDNWWRYTRTIKVPANYQSDFRLVFAMENGEAYIDDVFIEEIGDEFIYSSSQEADQPVRDSYMNVSGLAHWNRYGNPAVLEKNFPPNPSDEWDQELHIVTRGNRAGAQQLNIGVEAGATYRLSFTYQTLRGLLQPVLGIRTSNGDFQGRADLLRGQNTYTREFTVPQNFAGDFRLVFIMRDGEAYIDEVRMEKVIRGIPRARLYIQDAVRNEFFDVPEVQILQAGMRGLNLGRFSFSSSREDWIWRTDFVDVERLSFLIDHEADQRLCMANFNLRDMRSGATVTSGPARLTNNGGGGTIVTFSTEGFLIRPGMTREIALTADSLSRKDCEGDSADEFIVMLEPQMQVDGWGSVTAQDLSGTTLSGSHIVFGPEYGSVDRDFKLYGARFTLASPTLTFERSPSSVSQTFVKGTSGADIFCARVRAGDTSAIRVSNVRVRLLADDDGEFDNNGYGDTAANTVIESAQLFKVNADNTATGISGPVGMSLVGTIGSPGGYYKGEFTNLNYNITKGVTETWCVRARLSNVPSETRYIAADIVLNPQPPDVDANDMNGVAVISQELNSLNSLNNLGFGNPIVINTIHPSGQLTARQEGSPAPGIVIAGTNDVPFARYVFSAQDEAFTVTELDVLGTTTPNAAFDSSDGGASFPAGRDIRRVNVWYSRRDGASEMRSAILVNGKASFTNMAFYVPKDGSAAIKITADLNTIGQGAAAGDSFRLGIYEGRRPTPNWPEYLEVANSIEAIGEGSNEKKDATNNWGFENSRAVPLMTLREEEPPAQDGTITLADNGPVAQNIPVNTTNVHLFDFSLTSERNVTVKDYYVWLEQTAWDGTSAKKSGNTSTSDVASGTISAAGEISMVSDLADENSAVLDVIKITSGETNYYGKVTAVSGTTVTATLVYPASLVAPVTFADTDDYIEVFDAHLATRVKNIKLIDTDTQGTIASVTNSTYNNVFSDDFDLVAGRTKNLAVLVDLDSTLAANNALRGGVDFAEPNFIKDPFTNTFIPPSDVIGGNAFGRSMTAVISSLTVSRASTPVSETHVKGSSGVDLVCASVKAGDAGNVRVSKVTARLMGDDDGTFDNNGYGDTAANTVIESVELFRINADNTSVKISGPVGMSLVGTIGASGGYYKAEFTSLNYNVARSSTDRWCVRAKLSNVPSETRYVTADFVLGATPDIEAQDRDGNTVSPTESPANAGDSINNLGVGAPNVIKMIATSGSLIAAQEGSPDSAVVVAGANGVPFARYVFSAQHESFTMTKLDVVGTTTAADGFGDVGSGFTGGNNIKQVSVTYPKKDGTSETLSATFANGKASFTNMVFYIPKDGSAPIQIKADLNTIDQGATSGNRFKLGIFSGSSTATNAIEAIGEGSNEKKDATNSWGFTNASSVNLMTLRKTVPTVAKLSTAASKLNNGQNDIGGITVAADAKEAVALKRMAFEYASTDRINVSSLELYRKIGAGGEASITSQVSIRNRGGANLKFGGSSLSAAAATRDTVYIIWDKAATDQEFVTKGTTNTYLVRANVDSAVAQKSLSTYIADDTTIYAPAAAGDVAALRTTTAANPETSAASINNARTVWRWVYGTTACVSTNLHGCIFMETGGDGAYTPANDPQVVVAAGTTQTLASLLPIPGALRYARSDVNGEAMGTLAMYFDLNGDATYNPANDIAIPILEGSMAAEVVDNSAVAHDIRYTTTSTTLFIDRTPGDVYTAAGDDMIIPTAVTPPAVAPANNAELFTDNFNFIWSDNSNTAHTTSTTDWTNGVDIPSLPTGTVSLSF